ncbi:DNA-binding protein YbiB [Candidatus Zinderia endosymbiont of Aphrophora alni]|uniref:DNA-binding protein YbiB n=1 Tax=Candidatus Zinderia endosymbiont of Aphrophora alni TaxID=3077951 RepID=UPI0030CD79C7
MYYNSKFLKIIKIISNNKKKNNNLSKNDAYFLLWSILNNNISDIELGTILVAMRIKGETINEIIGFLKVIKNSFKKIKFFKYKKYAPIVIPSYNGTKKNINFIPLLALLLARENIPVLIHGTINNFNKITTTKILQKLGFRNAHNYKDINFLLKTKKIAFFSIKKLFPKIYRLLSLRFFLGIRNFANFLIKIIQPFSKPSLRLISYSHIKYFNILSKIFINLNFKKEGGVFLMKSTEGEVMTNIKKMKQINWFFLNKNEIIYNKINKKIFNIFLKRKNNIKNTAFLTKEILIGKIPIPFFIKKQIKICIYMSKMINLYN